MHAFKLFIGRFQLFIVHFCWKSIYQANMVDKNKQFKSNQIKTITAQTLEARFKSTCAWPIIHLVKRNWSSLDNTLQFQYFYSDEDFHEEPVNDNIIFTLHVRLYTATTWPL